VFHAIVKIGVALCLLAGLLAGCGGAENEPNLAQAAERTEATGSSRIAVHGTEKNAREAARFECEGEADYADARIRIACSYPSGDLELIVIGDSTYVRGAFLGTETGRKWLEFPTETEEFALREFTPEKLLAMLRDASTGTERVGEEDVRGDETVRYRLTVECEKANLDCATTSHVDVWIDGDGIVRRIAVEDDSAEGTIEFYDFGGDVDVEAPPADEVVDPNRGWTGYGPLTGSNANPCTGVEAKPITERKALDTLQSHDLSVVGDRSGYCVAGVAAVLENAPEDFPRQGSVSCFLHEKPEPDAPRTVTRSGVDGGDAQLRLANLTCMMFTDSPTGESKIDRLEAAFDELERAIRP
jgi:hypothetical protein